MGSFSMRVKAVCGKVFGSVALILALFGAVRAESESQEPPPYRIGPSDILSVYVWKEKDLTQDVVLVLPDGRITLPLVGEVMAQGQTVSDVRKAVGEKYEKYVTEPEVTIIVKEIRSRRVYLLGKVNKPGPYYLEPDMTVLQALSVAGGFAEWADTKNIVVVRREAGKEAQFRFNFREFVDGKNIEQNLLLKPNDTIVVP
jgi:polysaccharide export outer membrane protein